MNGFWSAYGLGMLAVVPGIAFGMIGGPVLGLVAGLACAIGVVSLGRVSVARVGGVVLGAATPFVAGFGLLMMVLANSDF